MFSSSATTAGKGVTAISMLWRHLLAVTSITAAAKELVLLAQMAPEVVYAIQAITTVLIVDFCLEECVNQTVPCMGVVIRTLGGASELGPIQAIVERN